MISQPDAFFNDVMATAERLTVAGMHEDANELRGSFYGATGGEIYGAVGVTLKRIAKDVRLPHALIPEIRREIDQIDEAFDRVTQPRPFAMKVETR
jgi:hypothetical protein